MKKLLLGTALGVLTISAASADTVTVVTSFPQDLTAPFKAAFEEAHPEHVLEVVNRNTNAAVAFLQETRDSNTTDIFWASAPDAFEVLKSEDLLAEVEISVEGIPDRIGSYPKYPNRNFHGQSNCNEQN